MYFWLLWLLFILMPGGNESIGRDTDLSAVVEGRAGEAAEHVQRLIVVAQLQGFLFTDGLEVFLGLELQDSLT